MLPSLYLLAQEEGEKPVLSQASLELSQRVEGLAEGLAERLAEEPIQGIVEGEDSSYAYDPAGKRDPFFPGLGVAPPPGQLCAEEPQTPLQSYEVGQLKLVGVIWNLEEPRALVEDGAGTGYIVTRNALVGSSCGMVKRIEPGQVVIEEYYYDFYGDRQAREVIMEIAASTE